MTSQPSSSSMSADPQHMLAAVLTRSKAACNRLMLAVSAQRIKNTLRMASNQAQLPAALLSGLP